jgi:uncharacterized protein
MTMVQRVIVAFLVLAFAGFPSANADQPVPELRSPVTDLTGTLSQAEAAALEAKLRTFEARKGAQVAVLVVRTTEPETIEQYARRVLDVWKLGRKDIDDGALLLVAVDDHDVRIETQYGLEGVLSDAISSRIIRETIVPQFKAGNFGDGIASGIDRMLAVIDGEPLPPPEPEWKQQRWQDGLPVLFILPIVLAGILRAIFGRFLGSVGTGAVMGVIAWFITALLPLAIGAAVLGFLIALIAGSGPGRWMSGGRGGWGGGGWGGGGGGWSSGGGGGWSGGGGGGGGGGASGRW